MESWPRALPDLAEKRFGPLGLVKTHPAPNPAMCSLSEATQKKPYLNMIPHHTLWKCEVCYSRKPCPVSGNSPSPQEELSDNPSPQRPSWL
jgi:hypothetical protein